MVRLAIDDGRMLIDGNAAPGGSSDSGQPDSEQTFVGLEALEPRLLLSAAALMPAPTLESFADLSPLHAQHASPWDHPAALAADTAAADSLSADVGSASGQSTGAELAWATYLGGSGDDYGNSVAVDAAGNVYVTGTTSSAGWITGGFDTTLDSSPDAFVVKFNPTGEHLWSTYLGAGGSDAGRGIAVDSDGNVIVTGRKSSRDFPGTDAHAQGIYVAKLTSEGELLWATSLGGSSGDTGRAVAVDSLGNILVTGDTTASGWVSGGFDTSYNGGQDAFVAKLSSTGAHLWSTYLGGSGSDEGRGIAVDATGHVLVTGVTASAGWTANGWDATHNGGSDAFAIKLDGDGNHLWSTYLGGSGGDVGHGIAVDKAGNAVVTGMTFSTDWAASGFDTDHGGFGDGFIVKLAPDGDHLWSTYLGGTAIDYGTAITVDAADKIFVTGLTFADGWVSGGLATTLNGPWDAFVVKLTPGGDHLWSTYVGGSDGDSGTGIAVDAAGGVLVTGLTYSTDLVTDGFDATHDGGQDVFVARIAPTGIPGDFNGDGTVNTDDVNPFILAMTNKPQYQATYGLTPLIYDTNGDGLINTEDINPFLALLSGSGDSTEHISRDEVGTGSGQSTGAELAWALRTGGNGEDEGYGIAVDAAGNVYVAGSTLSADWVSGGYNTEYAAGWGDAFVGKFSPTGEHIWSTYLGGSDWDAAYGIALDADGNVYVTGGTQSPDWIPGGFDTDLGPSQWWDGFVVKLSPDGAHLWSTYLGSEATVGYAIAVDAAGNVLVTGLTEASGWTTDGFDPTYNGGGDAFVVKLSPNGEHLWSTYLGGTEFDEGRGIATDAAGNVLVTGRTGSADWVMGGFDTTYYGGWEHAFVVKLSPTGGHLWSTYLGGDVEDTAYAIAVDAAGNAYVTGFTASSAWVSGGFDTTYNENHDAFVAKLSSTGEHLWSTYLGGENLDQGHSVAVTAVGDVLVTGITGSSGWVSDGFHTAMKTNGDVFVVKLNSAGEHMWSSYLGQDDGDYYTNGIAVDAAQNIYLTGRGDFPVLMPWGISGDFDAFVVKIAPTGIPGDFNGDGTVNTDDVNPFILAMTNKPQYQATYGLTPLIYDTNGDGLINTEDINPFLALLSGSGAGSGVSLNVDAGAGGDAADDGGAVAAAAYAAADVPRLSARDLLRADELGVDLLAMLGA